MKCLIFEVSESQMYQRLAMDKIRFLWVLLILLMNTTSLTAQLSKQTTRCHQCRPNTNTTDCSGQHPPLTTIPQHINQKTAVLNLARNQISILKSKEFMALSYLQKLNLEDNVIECIEDFAFVNLGRLQELKLKHNKISNLTRYTFSGLETLQLLDIHGSNIRTLANNSFLPLSKLNVLYLASCTIKSIEQNAFHGLIELQQLYLYDNKLATFSSHYLSHTPKLFKLHLDTHLLEDVPQDICVHAPLLQVVHISNNPVEILHFGNSFQKCKHLTSLRAGNEHMQIDENSFKSLSNHVMDSLNIYLGNVSAKPFKSFEQIREFTIQKLLSQHEKRATSLSNVMENILYSFEGAKIVNMILWSMTAERKVELKNTTFQALANVNIEELEVRQSPLMLHDYAFQWFPQLKRLALSRTSLAFIPTNAFHGLSNLIHLDLSVNRLVTIPTHALSAFSNLQILDLSLNSVYSIRAGMLSSLVTLREFYLSSNAGAMDYFELDVISNQSNLERLEFSNDGLLSCDTSYSKVLNNITYINFANTHYLCSQMYTGLCFLTVRFPKLSHLDISGAIVTLPKRPLRCKVPHLATLRMNKLDLQSQTLWCSLFQAFPNLKTLEFTKNGINAISSHCFSNVTSLTYLDLSINDIATLNPSIWNGLNDLITLDLRSNNIRIVNTTSFAGLTSLKYLYLGGNPFACTCDILWFHSWLTENPRALIFQEMMDEDMDEEEMYWLQDYKCFSPSYNAGDYLVDFDINTLPCKSHTPVYVATVAGILILLIISVTVLWRKFKWNIKYKFFLFKLKTGYVGQGYQVVDGTNEERRDQIMVSYGDDDYHWVRHEMMPRFEERDRFHLCIKDRDYLPGVAIVVNITECVHKSDKVVIVLSESFVDDHYCIFELEVALQRLFDELRDVIIMVQLGPIPDQKLPRLIRLLKCRKKCLRWTDDGVGQEMFWRQLKVELEKDSRLDHRTQLNLLNLG
ncbi:toll-like receptor 2 [Ptychodera flava]|uniref:toll-like receptor 2 n=1 Tax=Ptychodera flava TaxID=63121 RepID=UPI00396A289A